MLHLLLAILVGIEGVGLLAGAVFFFSQLFVQQTASVSGSIVIFLITLVLSAGLLISSFAMLQKLRWPRGGILTWQILQIAVATSFIQGLVAWQFVGWILLGLAILSLVFFFISEKRRESAD